MSSQDFPVTRIKLEKKEVIFSGYVCYIKIRPYNSGRIYMTLHDKLDNQQVARVTLDLDDIPHIPNLIIVKNYAENEGIYEALLKAGVVKECERKIAVGNEFGLVCFLNV